MSEDKEKSLFTVKKSSEFWYPVEFGWVNDDGEITTEVIEVRFKRVGLDEWQEYMLKFSKEVAEKGESEVARRHVDRSLMREVMVDVRADAEGAKSKKQTIEIILNQNPILDGLVRAYTFAVLQGGQTREALKKQV